LFKFIQAILTLIQDDHQTASTVPTQVKLPVTDKELSPVSGIIRFESNGHSIPAEVKVTMFVPGAMIRTELVQILTGAVVVILTSWKRIVTLMFSILRKCSVEDPVTNMVALEVSSVPRHVTFPEDTVTGSIVILQVIRQMK
jgi:hypothetical protein